MNWLVLIGIVIVLGFSHQVGYHGPNRAVGQRLSSRHSLARGINSLSHQEPFGHHLLIPILLIAMVERDLVCYQSTSGLVSSWA